MFPELRVESDPVVWLVEPPFPPLDRRFLFKRKVDRISLLARSPESKTMVGETEVKERPKSNPDYLMQLMNDRKVMSSLPNFSGIFTHLERLLDEGKCA